MGLTNFPNGVSSFGIPVMGCGDIPTTTGKIFFVDSTTGRSVADGLSPESPVANITQALLKCTAGKSDVIVVMPGHTETVSAASGLDFNKSGVTVIGIGKEGLRPTITLNTAATATIVVSAANVRLFNLSVYANFADIACAIVVNAADCVLDEISFRETALNMNFLSCIRTSATNNAADGLEVRNCERYSIDAAALAFISILANCDRLIVMNNFDSQSSAADVGHFIIMGAFVCLHARILGNTLILNGDNNAQTVGVFMTGSSTTSTGLVAYNSCMSLDTTTELFDTATLDFAHIENKYVGTIATSGKLWPVVDGA